MTVIITGASSGFGLEMTDQFINKGYKVIGVARREDKLAQLKSKYQDKFIPICADLSKTESIDNLLKEIKNELYNIELLINNAGLALGLEPADETNIEDWINMVNTNIIGLIYLTRKIIPYMTKNKKGHIINIGSVAGNYPYFGSNVYGATKAFVKQFTKNLKADLSEKNIRITNIEPGLCGGTEFSNVRFKGDKEKVSETYKDVEYLTAYDIAKITLWIFEQPYHVNINSIEIMPVAQTYAGLKTCKSK